MINLLPEENKNKVKDEYKARLLVVLSSLFSVSILIFIIFQTLFYVSIFSMERSSLNKLSIYKDNFIEDESKLNNDIRNINKKLSILKKDDNTKSIYKDIFNTIVKDRGNLKIIGLSYQRNKAGIKKVYINGKSPDRESIVKFVSLLNTEGFLEVNSPVSNFVKNKNIEFSVEVVL
jgi:hypothetical protein